MFLLRSKGNKARPFLQFCSFRRPIKALFTPSHVRSASDRTQFASDLASDRRSMAPFHSKQTRRTRDPGLLWSQSMVPNLCFRKRQPFFAHNFKRKSIRYSILSLHFWGVRHPSRASGSRGIRRRRWSEKASLPVLYHLQSFNCSFSFISFSLGYQ